MKQNLTYKGQPLNISTMVTALNTFFDKWDLFRETYLMAEDSFPFLQANTVQRYNHLDDVPYTYYGLYPYREYDLEEAVESLTEIDELSAVEVVQLACLLGLPTYWSQNQDGCILNACQATLDELVTVYREKYGIELAVVQELETKPNFTSAGSRKMVNYFINRQYHRNDASYYYLQFGTSSRVLPH